MELQCNSITKRAEIPKNDQMFRNKLKDAFRFITIRLNKQYPKTNMRYTLLFLRLFGQWAGKGNNETLGYKAYRLIVLTTLTLFNLSLTFDLYYASNDFDLLVEDICILAGTYLIMFKMYSYQYLQNDIEKFVKKFESYTVQTIYHEQAVKKKVLFYYSQEVLFLYSNIILAFTLFAAICIQPMVIDDDVLPFRGVFPFSTKGSLGYYSAYIFQIVASFYLVQIIVYIDNIGIQLLNETALQFEILSLKFTRLCTGYLDPLKLKRELGNFARDHQDLIGLVDEINNSFRPMLVAQVMASISIICLTAFEASLTMNNTSTLFKFVCYMFAEFMQLLYWCWAGNKVSEKSVKISISACNDNWTDFPIQIKKAICFILMRAQKPVAFDAKPFYVWNFTSFISILSGSYSYFTMLRTLRN